MALNFTTESGSTYRILEMGDERYIRRLNDSYTKRADDEWVRLHAMLPKRPSVGMTVSMVLEPLGRFGPDSQGRTGADDGYTTRLTSPVVEVWEDEA